MLSVSLFYCCEKGVYRCQYMGYLNMKDITDADYVHTKIVCEDFEIKI